MKVFNIDYSSYCQIKAETEKDAMAKFWEMVETGFLPCKIVEIDNIEE